jgi:hypothetical protein
MKFNELYSIIKERWDGTTDDENYTLVIEKNCIKKHNPKLFDSFGVELNKNDKFIYVSPAGSYGYGTIKEENGMAYSEGLYGVHNSFSNDGNPKDDWKIIKIDKMAR